MKWTVRLTNYYQIKDYFLICKPLEIRILIERDLIIEWIDKIIGRLKQNWIIEKLKTWND